MRKRRSTRPLFCDQRALECLLRQIGVSLNALVYVCPKVYPGNGIKSTSSCRGALASANCDRNANQRTNRSRTLEKSTECDGDIGVSLVLGFSYFVADLPGGSIGSPSPITCHL